MFVYNYIRTYTYAYINYPTLNMLVVHKIKHMQIPVLIHYIANKNVRMCMHASIIQWNVLKRDFLISSLAIP